MKRAVPTYDLYGEKPDGAADFWLHCETIPSRSSLHHWEIGLHRHANFFQILYVAHGSGDAVFGERIVRIAPPAVVTVPPTVGHGFRFSPDIDGFIFTMPVSHLRAMPGDRNRLGAFLSEPQVTALGADDADARYVRDTLERLGSEWFARRAGRTDLMEAYLTTTLTLAARLSAADAEEASTGDENERRVERLTALVHQHFRSHKPAAFYAAALGISPTHLNRVVRNITGAGAHEFINRKLVEEAKRELVFTSATAQEIGFRLGFADPAYFSRFFSRQTGLTPRAWREVERAKLAAAPIA
jgi:AraC family transcriptional activator of pobA